jgi:hypothetical protein
LVRSEGCFYEPLPTPELGSGVHHTTDEVAAAAEVVVVAMMLKLEHLEGCD